MIKSIKKEKTTSHEEIKYTDNNNLVKSLTEKDNQKKDRIFKNTYDTKQLNPENNSSKIKELLRK